MSPQVELVKKFLADNDSVSLEELRANIMMLIMCG